MKFKKDRLLEYSALNLVKNQKNKFIRVVIMIKGGSVAAENSLRPELIHTIYRLKGIHGCYRIYFLAASTVVQDEKTFQSVSV